MHSKCKFRKVHQRILTFRKQRSFTGQVTINLQVACTFRRRLKEGERKESARTSPVRKVIAFSIDETDIIPCSLSEAATDQIRVARPAEYDSAGRADLTLPCRIVSSSLCIACYTPLSIRSNPPFPSCTPSPSSHSRSYARARPHTYIHTYTKTHTHFVLSTSKHSSNRDTVAAHPFTLRHSATSFSFIPIPRLNDEAHRLTLYRLTLSSISLCVSFESKYRFTKLIYCR